MLWVNQLEDLRISKQGAQSLAGYTASYSVEGNNVHLVFEHNTEAHRDAFIERLEAE